MADADLRALGVPMLGHRKKIMLSVNRYRHLHASPLPRVRAHTRKHTHMHARTHARANTRTHAHARIRTHMHAFID